MNRAFERYYPAGIAVVVAIIVANTALSYRNTVQLYAAAERVARSVRVQVALEQVLTSSAEAESGQRGFVITGNERYLEPFKAAEQRIDTEVSRLAQLTRDNAEQEAEVPRLQRFIVQKLDELRLSIAVRKENGSDAARAIVFTDRGRVAMDSLHAVVERMEHRESEMIAAQTVAYARSRDWAVSTGLAAGFLALVLVTAFVVIQHRAVRSRATAAHALAEADRRKDEFLAVLAHELRNPLAPMRNALEMVRLSANDPAMIGDVRGTMERQVEHMVRLTDDLLDVSRITRNRLELRRKAVDLADVVQRALESTDPLLKESRHTVTIALPSAPLIVYADEGRLAQVLYNLLGNAAKYTPPGGRIHVQAMREDGQAVISVSDNGIGIAPDNLERVFEMFTQVDHSLERSNGGLGIGLTLSRRIVELHGGTIEAASEGRGAGTRMTVRLPASGAVAAPAPEPSRTFALARGRRVLIADDNRDSADTLAAMLRMVGHDVRICYDGVNALTQAELFKPDIMLLDIGMPLLNGLELAARVRERPWGSGMRLIALTGWGQPEDVTRSHRAGFDYHLVKPVELARLQELLEVDA